MPHAAVRVYVMGERAINFEDATPDDIAKMRELTEEGLKAGAFGFTTSRTESHRTTQGERVPARYAKHDELIGIGAYMDARALAWRRVSSRQTSHAGLPSTS